MKFFKSSIASHLSIQMRNAPVRQDNWDKISAVMEVFPDKFAEIMKKFGQKLVDKAKSKMNVKSKWVYDFKTLAQTFDEGQASNKSIKDGKIIVEDYGIQLINGSKPSDKIMIEDYDNLHAIFCEKNGGSHDVIFKGRKIRTIKEDLKDFQDPMEKLKLSKANRSNLTKKNMLVIAIKSISLGNFSKANRDSEVCVRIQCGNFHTRTSYMRENAGTVNINEKLTIDMDNHPKQEISIYVDVIDKNDLDQIEKNK